ncbi:MAG: lytic murein transglycosylase [Nanoarchaeota archaeon]|nr:lytic murein transglycosylase [Nanoarchaeota archaeon]MBU1321914.1 lytic murein transglycosylase [Nanoarchaeota archaeon]MBU1597607.1 lytic murein transglycosylase [Nanoarchaeota archaeon]MBU2440975.1 lytic murein transglycosylase [Nanoarchaeota archaeon]
MTSKWLKTTAVAGILICSLSAPAYAFQTQEKESKLETKVLQEQRDPFVPPSVLKPQNMQDTPTKKLSELKNRLVKEGLDVLDVLDIFADPRFKIHQNIIDIYTSSPEKKAAAKKLTYERYREILGLDSKIAKAHPFFEKHQQELVKVYEKYKVDPRYVVSILGIESDFTENPGKYQAVNTLVSLYMTRKKDFAYNELKELIDFSQKNKEDIFRYTSSYAGAIGWAQFIPSSLNSLFVGKSGDFKADPFNLEDCFYSIAHYLSEHNWNPKYDKEPTASTRNWKAILAYNKSTVYVKAVIELANSIPKDNVNTAIETHGSEKISNR